MGDTQSFTNCTFLVASATAPDAAHLQPLVVFGRGTALACSPVRCCEMRLFLTHIEISDKSIWVVWKHLA